MRGLLGLAMVLLATVLLSARPALCAPLVDPDFIPSLQSTAQGAPLGEEVKAQIWPAVGTFLINYLMNKLNSDSDTPDIQADLGDLAKDGNIDLDALADQLQNILNSQPSASTPTESVAEAQLSHLWPAFRTFFDQIFTPDDEPKDPDDTALAESLETALNRQILTGARSEPVARTQLWSSIRKFVGDLFAPKCSNALYIMAFTGGTMNSFTTDTPLVELQVDDKVVRAPLPDLPGDDFIKDKGDLWKMDLSDFGLTNTCITKGDVERITLVGGGNDGWLIDSVVTFLRTEDSFVLLSSDIDVNRWIDGNGGSEIERFNLSIV